MNSSTSSRAYGLASYIDTARQIATRTRVSRHLTLLRMLLVKARFGLSASEYGQYGLHEQAITSLGTYQTKKQTTALFDRINPLSERPQVEDKLRFHRRCLEAGLPVPVMHAVLSRRGTPGINDFPMHRSFADVVERFGDGTEVRMILKPQNDALGTGVRFVRLCHGEIFDITGAPLVLEEFSAALNVDMARDDYLVQEFVRPHPAMAALGSGKALGTLRILARLHDGDVELLYALSRIPCGNNPHDNFSGGRTGNLIAAVNTDDGRLHAAYGRRDARFDRLMERFEVNPDTGRAIAGEVVPEWPAIRAVVERAVRTFPTLPVLGWDIALSDAGVVIIEANSNPDIIGAQVCMGMGARQLLKALYAQ